MLFLHQLTVALVVQFIHFEDLGALWHDWNVVPFPVEVEIKIKVKGDGQECPSHTSIGDVEDKQVPHRAWRPVRNDIAQQMAFPQRLKPGCV